MKIAIIAGEGNLPVEIAKNLRERGEIPAALTVCSDPDKMRGVADPVIVLKKLQFSLGLRLLKENGVTHVIMAGVVAKKNIYSPAVLLDPAALKIFMKTRRDDHSILGAIVSWFEDEGMIVLPYTSYVTRSLAAAGKISSRAPSEDEKKDIFYGEKILKILLPLSFGQSIVVADEAVVAVEAMEGTDAVVARAGEILGEKFSKHKGTLIKMMRVDQDERYDLPTVGKTTIENMYKAGLSCLAVEAERTLIISPDEVVEAATRRDIAIWGIERQ